MSEFKYWAKKGDYYVAGSISRRSFDSITKAIDKLKTWNIKCDLPKPAGNKSAVGDSVDLGYDKDYKNDYFAIVGDQKYYLPWYEVVKAKLSILGYYCNAVYFPNEMKYIPTKELTESKATILIYYSIDPVTDFSSSIYKILKKDIPPADFQSYNIQLLLGSGSFGSVSSSSDDKVVIKKTKFSRSFFQGQSVNEYAFLDLFRNEKYVSQMNEVKFSKNTMDLYMKRYEGSIMDILETPALSDYKVAKELAYKIAIGLYNIQKYGVVHRDFKPGNILYHKDEKGVIIPAISDFGTAFITLDERYPWEGHRTTFLYRAPEYHRNGTFDRLCDIWALGLVFYQLVLNIKLPPHSNYREQSENIQNKKEFDKVVQQNKSELDKMTQKYTSQSIYSSLRGKADNDMIRLIIAMLDTNPETRISIEDVINFMGENKVEKINAMTMIKHLSDRQDSFPSQPQVSNFATSKLMSASVYAYLLSFSGYTKYDTKVYKIFNRVYHNTINGIATTEADEYYDETKRMILKMGKNLVLPSPYLYVKTIMKFNDMKASPEADIEAMKIITNPKEYKGKPYDMAQKIIKLYSQPELENKARKSPSQPELKKADTKDEKKFTPTLRKTYSTNKLVVKETIFTSKNVQGPALVEFAALSLFKGEQGLLEIKDMIMTDDSMDFYFDRYDGTLQDFLNTPRLNEMKVKLDVMRQISIGVYNLHKYGICHRDIKPENILLSFNDESKIPKVVLSNFGSCKLNCGMPIPYNGEVTTIWWAAPETFNQKETDNYMDIWSLGIVFLQILLNTENPPFIVDYNIKDKDKLRDKCLEMTDKYDTQTLNILGDYGYDMKTSDIRDMVARMLSTQKYRRPFIDDVVNLLSQKQYEHLSQYKYVRNLVNKQKPYPEGYFKSLDGKTVRDIRQTVNSDSQFFNVLNYRCYMGDNKDEELIDALASISIAVTDSVQFDISTAVTDHDRVFEVVKQAVIKLGANLIMPSPKLYYDILNMGIDGSDPDDRLDIIQANIERGLERSPLNIAMSVLDENEKKMYIEEIMK